MISGEALEHAHYDRATLYRDRALDLVDLAFQTLREVPADPKASPSVRLRAAAFIIEKAVIPPSYARERKTRPHGRSFRRHGCTARWISIGAPILTKIGRNDPCSCRSGRKYKHCCLDKPAAGAA